MTPQPGHDQWVAESEAYGMQPAEPWIWVYDDAARPQLRKYGPAGPDARPCAYEAYGAFNSWTNISEVKMLGTRLTLCRFE
jgi:hypothetical protein